MRFRNVDDNDDDEVEMNEPTKPVAPYRKISLTPSESPFVTSADPVGTSPKSTTTTMTMTTTTTAVVQDASTLVRPWHHPLVLGGFAVVGLVGVFLLVVDAMTPEQRVKLMGREMFTVVTVAANYLLQTSYLTPVAITSTLCGVCGLVGLLGGPRICQGVSYIFICVLCLFCWINCLVELGLGIYGTVHGEMYQEYLSTFGQIGAVFSREAASHAVQATALHYWLGCWFCLASGAFWGLGDTLVRVTSVVDGRKALLLTVFRESSGGRREGQARMSRVVIGDA